MASTGMHTVIGCGNLNRSDDGVGVIVARRVQQWLAASPCEEVAVFDAGTAGMDVMFQARGSRSLILVDACASGSQPGSVFKVPGEELAHRPEPGYSLHNFRWDHALYAGKKIFGATFPRDVTVYLVEAATTNLGCELSPEVSRAADRVVASIQAQLREKRGRPPGEPDRADADTSSLTGSANTAQIHIRHGNIYLTAEVYATYFNGLESLVLLKKDEALLLLPVRHVASGGLLIKLKNSRGDRVVHAQEFLRDQAVDEGLAWTLPVRWDSGLAALVARWPAPHDPGVQAL